MATRTEVLALLNQELKPYVPVGGRLIGRDDFHRDSRKGLLALDAESTIVSGDFNNGTLTLLDERDRGVSVSGLPVVDETLVTRSQVDDSVSGLNPVPLGGEVSQVLENAGNGNSRWGSFNKPITVDVNENLIAGGVFNRALLAGREAVVLYSGDFNKTTIKKELVIDTSTTPTYDSQGTLLPDTLDNSLVGIGDGDNNWLAAKTDVYNPKTFVRDNPSYTVNSSDITTTVATDGSFTGVGINTAIVMRLSGNNGARGEQGDKGPQGPIGAIGDKGPTGDKGATSTTIGPQGDKGPQGHFGIQGVAGDKGPTGLTGPIGNPGASGVPHIVANVINSIPSTARINLPSDWKTTTIGLRITIGNVSEDFTSFSTSSTQSLIVDGRRVLLFYRGNFVISGDAPATVATLTENPLRGPQGDKGATGDKGVVGDKGAVGPQGTAAPGSTTTTERIETVTYRSDTGERLLQLPTTYVGSDILRIEAFGTQDVAVSLLTQGNTFLNLTSAGISLSWSRDARFLSSQTPGVGFRATLIRITETTTTIDGPFRGDKGPIGDKGLIGDKGPIGFQGNRGPTGFQGPTGTVRGATGDKGPIGLIGENTNLQYAAQSGSITNASNSAAGSSYDDLLLISIILRVNYSYQILTLQRGDTYILGTKTTSNTYGSHYIVINPSITGSGGRGSGRSTIIYRDSGRSRSVGVGWGTPSGYTISSPMFPIVSINRPYVLSTNGFVSTNSFNNPVPSSVRTGSRPGSGNVSVGPYNSFQSGANFSTLLRCYSYNRRNFN